MSQGGNQGWSRDEGWKDRDRELRDQNPSLKEGEEYIYVPPHECQKSEYSDGGRFQDMLSHILEKDKGSKKISKERNEDMSIPTQIVTSNFISIKHLEIQMG